MNRVRKREDAGDPEGVLRELRLYEATRCGARTRKGTPCKRKALESGRCPNHGGLSTGPRTTEGRLRALRNLRQYRGLREDEIRARLTGT